jgi:hypothetical protein
MCYYYAYTLYCPSGYNAYYGDCCMAEGWAIFLWCLLAFWIIIMICGCIAKQKRRQAMQQQMMMNGGMMGQRQEEVIIVNNGQQPMGQQAYGGYQQQAYGQQPG